MPDKRTADRLVRDVRDYLQIYSPVQLRDGFADDPLDDDGDVPECPSILDWINTAYTDTLVTGYVKCIAHLTVDGTQDMWELSHGINEIVRVTREGVPLDRVTILGMDNRKPGWSSTSVASPVFTGPPTEYFTLADLIGFFPKPDKPYTFDILCDVLPADLIARTDVPERLPYRYHSVLSIGGALYLNSMIELENPMSDKRVGILSAKWNSAIAEIKDLVNDRGDDSQDNIGILDYRKRFR